MSRITIKDKTFEPYISHEEIQQRIEIIARQIDADYTGKKPIFLIVLNGAFMFASDLVKNIDIECEVSFVKLASYEGTSSTGKVKELIGLDASIQGREIIVVEDIVDTGVTLEHLYQELRHFQPATLRIATLLYKPGAYRKDIRIDYVGMEVPNDFLLGYGLDYDGLGRNLKGIYALSQ